MDIGFVGLGKLGLPCALAINSKGHNVKGYDINQEIKNYLLDKKIPYYEKNSEELLNTHTIQWTSLEDVINSSEIIFLAIQTPHDKNYEGVTRLPKTRENFDYRYLKDSVIQISKILDSIKENKIIVIISTVLPGTIREEIKPLLSKYAKLCYNPFFIAMGSTIDDYLNPEFVLLGVDDLKAANSVTKFYNTLHNSEVFQCTIEEAEMIKVSYNTFITMKICLANTIMEASHKLTNINVDNVINALKKSNNRLISPKYLDGGMGDGGGCHPRDNIALSWLAQKLDLSYDWYENLMKSRENSTVWLAELVITKVEETKLKPIILGKSFKKETNIETGSPAILLKNILEEKIPNIQMYDPYIDNFEIELKKAVYFIGTNHDIFKEFSFPIGSVVIDPWRIVPKQNGIELIQVGVS